MNVRLTKEQNTPWQKLLLSELHALSEGGLEKKFAFCTQLKELLENADHQGVSREKCEEIEKHFRSIGQ